MTVSQHTREELVGQPAGYWTTEASRHILRAIRGQLASERLTQPHWWVLNHVAGAAQPWTRSALAAKLDRFADPGTDFDAVFDDLLSRGWLAQNGTGTPRERTLSCTDEGEAGRQRAKAQLTHVHTRMHAGITDDAYLAALDVLRRLIDNLGGDAELP